MRFLKTYEELDYEGKSNKFFINLSKNEPNYKIGDPVKYIGPDKPGLNKDEIYCVIDVTLENIGDKFLPDYYWFARIKNGFNLYSAKFRKLTPEELEDFQLKNTANKYNI